MVQTEIRREISFQRVSSLGGREEGQSFPMGNPPEKYFGLKKMKFRTRLAKCIPSGTRINQNGDVGQKGTQKTPVQSEDAARKRIAFAIMETGGHNQR